MNVYNKARNPRIKCWNLPKRENMLKNFLTTLLNSEHKTRVLTAITLILALVVIFSINKMFIIWLTLGGLFIVSIYESLRLYKIESQLHFYLASVAIWLGAYITDNVANVFYPALIVLMIYAAYLSYTKNISPKTFFPFIYPTLPFLALLALYMQHDRLGLICLIVIVACTDTAAYFGGKAFGKTPFCPTSPKKTIEGVVVGIFAGGIVGSILLIGFTPNFFLSVLYSFLIAISSVFGDLFESYLKREAELKDSGTLFPGHGGVLDRLDAVLFGGVTMLFLLSLYEI